MTADMTTENSVRVPRELSTKGIGIVLDYINANIGAIAPTKLWALLIDALAAPAPAGEPMCEKGQAFKDYVHQRLDAMGAPHSVPESEHDKAGCRIGGRLDWIEARIATPKPEQEVGLADEVLSIIDEWMAGYDHMGTGDSGSERTSLRQWEADRARIVVALARQQSRVVDEAMVERAREAYFDACPVGDGAFTNADAMRAALRAALEGDRDGR